MKCDSHACICENDITWGQYKAFMHDSTLLTCSHPYLSNIIKRRTLSSQYLLSNRPVLKE